MQVYNLIEGSINKHLVRMALPSIGGMFAMTVFNLTDTYFVSKLGTEALAAMGFTFPIVMITGAIAGGISLGAGSILARALGREDYSKVNKVATNGILLAILTVCLIAIMGLMTMDLVFPFLGAEGMALEFVKKYMGIWYAGAGVVVVPMVSDTCMRARGDMVRPFYVMVSCAVLNAILDPLLIFGLLGMPEMGIEGAAIATLISRAVGMVLTLSFVAFHYHMIDLTKMPLKERFSIFKEILNIGIPNIAVRLIPQLIRAAMTKFAAGVAGVAGVAAVAAGLRIESFATIVSMALGVSIVPLVGQNWGAKKFDRVSQVRRSVSIFALVYGILLAGASIWLANPVVGIFTQDGDVIHLASQYLLAIFIGTIGLNTYNWTSECFNATGRPSWAIKINVIGTSVLVLPMIFLGSRFWGYQGLVWGLAIGQILLGFVATFIGERFLVDLNH